MKIEKKLKSLALDNPNYSLLWAQWEFDKALLTKSLNTINRDFPHYSLHDSSHSNTIINQIEKIISKDIPNLSATDCWLILESCYWHDSGMILSDKIKSELLTSDEFRFYLETAKNSSPEIAELIIKMNKDSEPEDHFALYDKSRALTYVISDYFRRKHADRSGYLVNSPIEVNIMSPRTSLIPSRLFGLVAEIVTCHGQSSEHILKLSKTNDGMDSDDYAHPRYVASLLRIGDLLDIDDGRFCPTLLANIGEVPSSSLSHQKKHASIKHLHIDSSIIEIKSSCPDYESFEVQNSWFNYIKDEFNFQRNNWNKIVPNETFRSLPVISELTCQAEGLLDIDGGIPKVELHSKRAYEYLSSDLLYSDKYSFLREMIQNSLDSIYYKVWEDNFMDHGWGVSSTSKDRLTFLNLLGEESIIVDLKVIDVDDVDIHYELLVTDSGKGMNKDNIKKMLNVGSPLNIDKIHSRSTMADWAKPSGFFGLGMQSIFIMNDKTTIETRTIKGEEFTLSAEKKKNGELFFKLFNSDIKKKVGTTLHVYFKYPKVPNRISYGQIEYLNAYDPVVDELLEIIPHIFHEKISEHFSIAPVKIYFNKVLINDDEGQQGPYKRTAYEFGADYNLFVNIDENFRKDYKYKGVVFESNVSVPGIAGVVDLFAKDASYWLTIDRQKLNSRHVSEFNTLLDNIIFNEYKNIISDNDNKVESMFYFYAMYNKDGCEKWDDYVIEKIKISDYFNGKNRLMVTNKTESYVSKGSESRMNCHQLKSRLLGMIVARNNLSFSIIQKDDEVYEHHGVSKTCEVFEIDFSDDGLNNQRIDLDIVKKWANTKPHAGCARGTLPLFDEKYIELALTDSELEPWMYCYTEFRGWFNKYLLMPNLESNPHVDIEKILSFYKRKKLLSITNDEFKSLYYDLWGSLGLLN